MNASLRPVVAPTLGRIEALGTRGQGASTVTASLFVTSVFILAALVPLVTLLHVSDSGRSDSWIATLGVIVWAGLRLSHRLASGEPRLFDFIFWLFTYIFMGLAPTVQIRTGDIASTTPGIDAKLDLVTVTAVWVGIVAYEIGTWWGRRRRSHAASRDGVIAHSKAWDSGLSARGTAVLLAIGLVSAAYLIQAIGLDSLFLSRHSSYVVRASAIPDPALRSIIGALASTPLLVAAGSFILLRRSTPRGARRDLLGLGIAAALIPLIIIMNPISRARYEIGTVGFALIVFAGAMSSKRLSRASMTAVVIAFLFVFPIADAFRTDIFGVHRSGFFGEYSGNGDYDAFWQVSNTLAYVDEVGLNVGQQFLGALLFWVPRSIWPGKPVDTGIALAEFRGYDFTNISSPLWSELLVNGSWVALVVGFVAFGLILYSLDTRVATSMLGHGQLWVIVGAVFPFLMVMMLRGSLMVATGQMVVAALSVLMIRRPNRTREFSADPPGADPDGHAQAYSRSSV